MIIIMVIFLTSLFGFFVAASLIRIVNELHGVREAMREIHKISTDNYGDLHLKCTQEADRGAGHTHWHIRQVRK